MKYLTIIDNNIHHIDGLYSLNDLHKASGGEKRHQPSNFLRKIEAREVVEELEKEYSSNMRNTKPLVVYRGNGAKSKRGTYVCKELVYSYAMWISAKFHLKVVRAFDDFVTGKVSNINQEKLYDICSNTVEMGMEYLSLIHNISTTLANDNDYQLKGIAEKVINAINFSKENNLTNRRNEPMFDCGELNFTYGNKIIYTPKKMAMLQHYSSNS